MPSSTLGPDSRTPGREPLSNMRLKLAGLLSRESAVRSPGGPQRGGAGPLRRSARRPQLKRDSLGGSI